MPAGPRPGQAAVGEHSQGVAPVSGPSPRTSSIGFAAAATSSPKTTDRGCGQRTVIFPIQLAFDELLGLYPRAAASDPAEPMPVPTRRRGRVESQSKTSTTAMTIAFSRPPTLENCCGPGAGSIRKAGDQPHPSASRFALGPVKNSRTGTRRVADVEASSTCAVRREPAAGARRRPGEAVPRFATHCAAIFRICG